VGFVIISRSSALSKQLEYALVKIEDTLDGMFNRWERSFTKNPSAPVQLRLLATAVERNFRGGVLRLAVNSSPRFSDAGFTKMLLDRLVLLIHTAGDNMRNLAMLCFCVLCATDGEFLAVSKVRNNS
jgi:hypothetical protein